MVFEVKFVEVIAVGGATTEMLLLVVVVTEGAATTLLLTGTAAAALLLSGGESVEFEVKFEGEVRTDGGAGDEQGINEEEQEEEGEGAQTLQDVRLGEVRIGVRTRME